MSKVRNPEDNESGIRKIEGRILEKLFTESNQQTPLTSDNDLRGILTGSKDPSNFTSLLKI